MTERFHNAYPVSWDQLHRDARALARRLAELGTFGRVIAVTRGGMVPACVVARELEVRRVDAVSVVSYDHMHQGDLEILTPVQPREGADPSTDLVVDDLVDTGSTLAAIRKLLPHAHYATVYAKPEGRAVVDTFITEFPQDTWIHLPWDTELRYAAPLAASGHSRPD